MDRGIETEAIYGPEDSGCRIGIPGVGVDLFPKGRIGERGKTGLGERKRF